jgi:hypothetical protein
MPYITPEDRKTIDEDSGSFVPRDGGELQYAIARLIDLHYSYINATEDGVRYKHMEAMMGSLNGASLEHYRCVVAPYEDLKIKENGGVYDVKCGKSY